MADELNVPTHRWYEPRNNISLPKTDFSAQTIYASGIQKIDAWINSQPWGNPVPGLFALAEPGVWYDPSDLTTMFQDAAGTTPVTAAGQPVGLVLDKSQGLVLGPELVTNGDFSGGTTGWSGTSATLSEVSGRLRVTNSSASPGRGRQTIATVIGRTYAYRVDAFLGTASSLRFRVLDASLNAIANSDSGSLSQNSVGTVRYFTATTATSIIELLCNDSVLGNYAEFDNISVRELPGNHATQTTAASRPTYGVVPLGGRRNLLVRSEEFDNAAWVKTSGAAVTANTNIAPDGTATADTVSDNSSSTFNSVSQASAYSSTMTATIYVRKDSTPRTTRFSLFRIAFSGGTARDAQVALDTSTGEVSSVGSTATVNSATAVDAGDYWRLTISGTDNRANTSVNLLFFPAAGASSTWVLTASVTGSAVVWGAQLEPGSTATAYQRVTTAFDVTEAGVQSLSYLSFDGVDDFLVTPTITPNIDKAQVFAGVRKLSDAAFGIVAEVSADVNSNSGSFNLSASPTNVTRATYGLASRGSILVSFQSPATFSAPISNVLTGLGDISGDLAALRLNGTQVAQSTADQGTGNYLAYPLYIGRRGGTTLPFNGNIFSLIVRFGANLDANTITNTETWVNSKTGAY